VLKSRHPRWLSSVGTIQNDPCPLFTLLQLRIIRFHIHARAFLSGAKSSQYVGMSGGRLKNESPSQVEARFQDATGDFEKAMSFQPSEHR
jgi:hypothetical protein